jgi:hypothetical protein
MKDNASYDELKAEAGLSVYTTTKLTNRESKILP